MRPIQSSVIEAGSRRSWLIVTVWISLISEEIDMAKSRVLITVKTYPHPSRSYQELACTAGVLEDGTFIRLYPIPYRYQPYEQQYRKYEWIEVEVEKHDKDPRKESFRPKIESIRCTGEVIKSNPKDGWADRRRYVLAKGTQTMEELWALQGEDKTSLGIVRPAAVTDFTIESDDPEWKPEWQALFQQLRLFGPNQKPLEKIPFKFSYKFKCQSPDCKGHKMMIEDWEVGQLYRNEVLRLGSAERACESVRKKFYDQMCGPDKDTHFFVGTVLKHGTWVILGVFWPPRHTETRV
jgi:hypothetical protein